MSIIKIQPKICIITKNISQFRKICLPKQIILNGKFDKIAEYECLPCRKHVMFLTF